MQLSHGRTIASTLALARPRRVGPSRAYSVAPGAPPQASIVRSSKHEGLTFLQLDRAKAKNALSVQMVHELRQLIEEIRFDGSVPPPLSRTPVFSETAID